MGETRKLPEWRELLDWAVECWDYGEFHSHEEISQVMGLEYPSRRYYQQVQKANRELLKHHQKYLDQTGCRGEGYRVIEPNEHLKAGQKVVRNGVSRMRQGVEVVAYTDRNRLTPEENRRVTDYLARTSRVLHSLTKEVRELDVLAGGKMSRSIPRMIPKSR